MHKADTRKSSTGLAGVVNLNLLAPIKDAMVAGFEPISHRERLRKVLDALQASRRNARESELMPPAFGDSVGEFGIIHHFRYSIVPPAVGLPLDEQPLGGVWHLSLNVTFDGGWEPYMRVIYRDLGTLLDLLLCHTVGYRLATEVSFDDYCKWVRQHEVEGGLFYTDSAAPLGDQAYLAKLEEMQREGMASELDMARLGLPSAKQRRQAALDKAMQTPQSVQAALVVPLRTLKGLHRLSVFFDGPDHDILSRFARVILRGTRGLLVAALKLPQTDPRFQLADGASKQLAEELKLIEPLAAAAPAPPAATPIARKALQSHMLAQHEGITHGCLVLLRVTQPNEAQAFLSSLASQCGPLKPGGIGYLVAFTYAGLEKLAVHPQRLSALPQEFADGMEARAGLLGDVRGNHPDHWPLPLAWGLEASGLRVEMKAVHVLVQLRLADPDNASHELHPRLRQKVEALQAPASGLRVLAVQETRSYRTAPQGQAPAQVEGHFGFVDGISQPVIRETLPANKAVAHSDLVSAGELLLGYANDRDDKANPALEPLLMDGSFLVVRKLRQRVDHLHHNLKDLATTEREQVLACMMGRPKNGSPPVPLPSGSTGPNDFNFDAPEAGSACPLHSHIRRTNPRDGRPYTPRILRRGMSYGPKSSDELQTERGVVFMAYCASLAEQFETIQRWVSGGNNTGVSSAQADPFLRVPQFGVGHTFRFVVGSGYSASVHRVRFDDKPLVQMEWGLYSFVPSIAVLEKLAAWQIEPTPAERARGSSIEAARTEDPALDELRQLLEDEEKAEKLWKDVRNNSTPKTPAPGGFGTLVGTCPAVLEVLKNEDADRYSVQGYGQRMKESLGLNHLGMDPYQDGQGVRQLINGAIEAVTEELAYGEAARAVAAALKSLSLVPPVTPGQPKRYSVDLLAFSDQVVASLCSVWVGLPDAPEPPKKRHLKPGGRHSGVSEDPPRCPGNFATASRFIFGPYPRTSVQDEGKNQGAAVLKAVEDWLNSEPKLGSVASDILGLLKTNNIKQTKAELAAVLAGVMLGFGPTVQGNFINTMKTWIETEQFWQLQQDLLLATPQGPAQHGVAQSALLTELLRTMRQQPVPAMLWRSPVDKGLPVLDDERQRVVLGIQSALKDDRAPIELMFGRDDREGHIRTVHGCPGMKMAKGVLLAMLAGLMQAGTLRPTGSPVLLILTPRQPPAPAPSPPPQKP